MLNLFTLQFKDKAIEKSYVENSKDKIIMEFTAFAMLISVNL